MEAQPAPEVQVRRARRWATAGRAALPYLPLATLVAAYALRFALLSVTVYDGYGDPPYDLGIFDQGVWLLSRFHAPFVTIMGRDLFGDHTSFILLLAVPIYWVYPHVAALLILQACLIAAAAIPIYLVARPRLGHVLATLMAAVYLLNPALQNGNLEQFHPEAFLVLGVAVALWAAVEGRPVALGIAVAMCLLCKEDVGLLMVPLGCWVMWKRDRRWGLRIAAASVGCLLLMTLVVIRLLLGTSGFYANRVPFGGIGGLVTTVLLRPRTFWDYATSQGRLFYLWQMMLPAGFAFLRAPSLVLVGILTLAVNVLSDFGYMHQILYHYSLPLVPLLVMGSVWGLAAIRRPAVREAATVATLTCAFIGCVVWGLAPFSVKSYPHWSPDSPQVHAVDAVLHELPADAVVSAYYPYVSHIEHRPRVYMWPTPFRATYWGLYTQEGQRLPFASQITWLVLPTELSQDDGATTFASISRDFHLVTEVGGVALYERN